MTNKDLDLKLLNLAMTIITGSSTAEKARTFDIWDCEYGVQFFYDIVVLIAPKDIKTEINYQLPEAKDG